MRRSQLIDEPFSRVALWSPRLAALALGLAALAAASSRFGRLDPVASLSMLAAALICAGVAILAAIAAYGAIWRHGLRGAGAATLGLVMALALLAWPTMLSLQAARLPPATDVSTDAVDPPDFSRSAKAALARAGRWISIDDATRHRAAVARAYPDMQPITLELDPDEAFKLVEKVAGKLRWTLVDARPPGGRLGRGHLDYIDRSLIFGFPTDVAIRFTPLVAQTRLDMRSAAGVGGHDVGDGARRYRKFEEALRAELGDE